MILATIKLQAIRFLSGILMSLITFNCTDEILIERSDWLPDVDHFLVRDTAALNIFVISDWGFNGGREQLQVADQMAEVSNLAGLDFIISCGDNFQVSGVESPTDMLWVTNLEDIYNDSSLNVPWFPALGNHDYDGNIQAQIDYSVHNDQWNMPSEYYTYTWKVDAENSLRVIVMDTPGLLESYSNLADDSEYASIPQYQWLVKTLSESSEKWVIVVGHHPVFSAGSYHGDTEVMKSMIKPLFVRFGVDIYLSGHDHNFEHAREEGIPVNYIVTGTGGTSRYVGSNSRTVFSLATPGFTYLSVLPESLTLYFITSDGKIGYHFTI